MSSNELVNLDPLTVQNTLRRSAMQRVEHGRRGDLSGIGLRRSGVFSNTFTASYAQPTPGLIPYSQPIGGLPFLGMPFRPPLVEVSKRPCLLLRRQPLRLPSPQHFPRPSV
jgi:hypothetical protein